jgi:hypothetical protein
MVSANAERRLPHVLENAASVQADSGSDEPFKVQKD